MVIHFSNKILSLPHYFATKMPLVVTLEYVFLFLRYIEMGWRVNAEIKALVWQVANPCSIHPQNTRMIPEHRP